MLLLNVPNPKHVNKNYLCDYDRKRNFGDFLVLVTCHISINSYSRQITVCGNTAQPSDLFFEIFHKRKKVKNIA